MSTITLTKIVVNLIKMNIIYDFVFGQQDVGKIFNL